MGDKEHGDQNVWTCKQCNRSIKAHILSDDGVTPFGLGCYATPNCTGTMYSRMFRYQPKWDVLPFTHEWWHPTEAEIDWLVELAGERGYLIRDHVMRFGLWIRETPEHALALDNTTMKLKRAPRP